MGDTAQRGTQADQDHEGKHQVAAGRVTGAGWHGAAPRHTAAVGVEDLGWGAGEEEASGTSKDKQLAKGMRLQEACKRATDTNNTKLGQTWLDAGTSDPVAESG